MTTSRPPGRSGGRYLTDPVIPQDSESAAAAPDNSVPPAARPADVGTGPPDDIQELRQEIEQTRQQLGETVGQLAAKADVKAQARDKAAELAGRVKGKTSQARTQAAASAGKVRDQLTNKTGTNGERVMSLGTAAKVQVSGRLVAAAKPAWQATPQPVRQAVANGASRARERRTPLAVAAGMLIVAYLAIRRWRRR